MNINFTLYILFSLGVLFFIMILAWLSSSKINSKDYGRAASYNQWIIFLSSLSFVILMIFGGYLIYSARREIAKLAKSAVKTTAASLQKIAT